MSAQIRYAYLKGQTWLYRRNYPKDVAALLGQKALKQSLKTGDLKLARKRAAEVNTQYERTVEEALSGALSLPSSSGWSRHSEEALARLRDSLQHSEQAGFTKKVPKDTTVENASRCYLHRRIRELRPGGFKSVRYSVELFASKHGQKKLSELVKEDGKEFLSLISKLSANIGKSQTTRGLSLDAAVTWSMGRRDNITGRTQRRIWAQVNQWLTWCVYEDLLEANPFAHVRFEAKIRPQPYAVPTDDEVKKLLSAREHVVADVMKLCLFSGMRAGEAAGLLGEDIVDKGSAGLFFHLRPNHLRLLKTEAAERWVPVHPELLALLKRKPKQGPLFPDLTVNDITKRFALLRKRLKIERPGLVFHSTRKWFITQCERTGAPGHFTASIVGHSAARSENGITYSLYSAGISDQQKRDLVDRVVAP